MSTAQKRKSVSSNAGPDAKKPKQNGTITAFFGVPKAASASSTAGNNRSASAANGAGSSSAPPRAPAPAASTFNKAKWVAGLTDEQKTLLRLEIDTLHESWLAVLKDEITTKEFLDLKRFLDRETAAGKKWFPPREDVYSWSQHTPFSAVKVVILGQDPYHNVNQAHGLAFSVRPPTPVPPSLRNMYICLKNDYPGSFVTPPRTQGSLMPWADRGVLLLNTCLTVRAHEANSHANRGWERFTQRVIDLVAARRASGVVFMAWGTPAGKRVLRVDQRRHLVLKSVHPSPLSASRGYFDCGHFRTANDWLVDRYGPDGEVDWGLTEGCSTLERRGKDGGLKAVDTVEDEAAEKAEKKEKEEDEFGDVDDDEWEAAAATFSFSADDVAHQTAAVVSKAAAVLGDGGKGKGKGKGKGEGSEKSEDDENVEPKSEDEEED